MIVDYPQPRPTLLRRLEAVTELVFRLDFQNSAFLTVIPAWKYWAKITLLASNSGCSVRIFLFPFESAKISSTVALSLAALGLPAVGCQLNQEIVEIVGVVVDGGAAVVLLGSRRMPPWRMVARTSTDADAVERVNLDLVDVLEVTACLFVWRGHTHARSVVVKPVEWHKK